MQLKPPTPPRLSLCICALVLLQQLLLHCPPARCRCRVAGRAAPLLCRAAQLLTDREMRGGDAGWGHKQGEAEEEKAERESPALEYTATTRRQRERGRDTERLAVFFFVFWGGKSTGSLRRRGYELKRNTGRGRDRVPISRNI